VCECVYRFLYINSRAWPKGYTISDPLYPPPIAESISIHVLDLQTMTESGPQFHSINSRAWPKGYTISDPLYPPPIAESISIHVLDLQTMTESGPQFHSHKAFTSNDECFFIFLDVSDPYVAR